MLSLTSHCLCSSFGLPKIWLFVALIVLSFVPQGIGQGTRIRSVNSSSASPNSAVPARRYAVVRLPSDHWYHLSDVGIFPWEEGYLGINRKGWAFTASTIVDLTNNREMPLLAPGASFIDPKFINDQGDVMGFFHYGSTPRSYGFWVGSAAGAWENGASFESLPRLPNEWLPEGTTEDGVGQEWPHVGFFDAVANDRKAIARASSLNQGIDDGVSEILYSGPPNPGPTLFTQLTGEDSIKMSNNDEVICTSGILYENKVAVRTGIGGSGINDQHQIAGSGNYPASLFERFKLPNGQKVWDELDLNELIFEESHWVIEAAYDINNHGVIQAYGRQYANPSDPTEVTDEGALLLLPFELSSDLNNDGKAGEGADSSLKTAGAEDTASDEAKEKATEYLFVNDQLSNGAWDVEDQSSTKPPTSEKKDDDLTELKTICNATWGAIWFEYEGGDVSKLKFYRTKECKQTADDLMTFPFPLSTEQAGKLPEKLYVRAEGDWTAQVEGKLLMKFGKADKSETYATDKLRFTVVKHIGDTKYFRAARDYIWENNTKFFVNERKYGTVVFRIVVMREETSVLYAVDAYNHASDTGRLWGIDQVVSNYAADVVINGNQCYSSHGDLYLRAHTGMTDRCDGRLVVGRQVLRPPSEDNHHDLGGEKYGRYIGHWLSPNRFVFGRGRVPENAGANTPDTALGGLSTNYGLDIRQTRSNQIVGYVPAEKAGEGLVFTATNVIGSWPFDAGGKGLEFSQDAARSGVPSLPGGDPNDPDDADDLKLFHLDGSTSVALSYTTPEGDSKTVIKGEKHNPGLGSYWINTYLLFECEKPRNP